MSSPPSQFQKVMDQILQGAGVLDHYDVNLPIKLQCDTSPYAVRAVLSHVMDSGENRPIAFASRMLQAVNGTTHRFNAKLWRYCLDWNTFINISSAENSHLWLITSLYWPYWVPRLLHHRWPQHACNTGLLTLAAYNYDIEFRKDSEHANADCFSGLLCESQTTVDGDDDNEVHALYRDELPVNSKDIANTTHRDPVLAHVYEHTMKGWPDKIKDEQLKPYFIRRHELATESGCNSTSKPREANVRVTRGHHRQETEWEE